MDFDASTLADFAMWYLGFLISTTCHEFCHAWAAFRGGDPTAYHGGQLTVDPTPHIKREPVGMVVVPLLTFFSAGWMMGWASVPYDPLWAHRHPRRAAFMSAAGPLANLALALLAFLALKTLLAAGLFEAPQQVSFSRLVAVVGAPDGDGLLGALAVFLSVMLGLNLLLGVFNLIPLPPLDGAGVVEGLFPERTASFYARFHSSPGASLLGLLLAALLLGEVVSPLFQAMLWALHPGAVYG